LSVRGIRTSGDELLFDVHLAPRASRSTIEGWDAAGRLRVRVHAPPVDGAANEALCRLVAERLGVPRRDVRLARGESSRDKSLAVSGVALDRFTKILGSPSLAADSQEAA
jgi:uncharacterized protein (TIGR00251 family)